MDPQTSPWTFTNADGNSGQGLNQQPVAPASQVIEWEGDEFIAHTKNSSWFMTLGGGAAGLSAVLYLLTRDIIPVIVIIVMAVMLGYLAARKPRRVIYRIDNTGFTIGDRHYPIGIFKSFSVHNQGQPEQAIWLMPLKRFVPIIMLYFQDNAEAIVELTLDMMPYEEHAPDVIDRLMQRIRY